MSTWWILLSYIFSGFIDIILCLLPCIVGPCVKSFNTFRLSYLFFRFVLKSSIYISWVFLLVQIHLARVIVDVGRNILWVWSCWVWEILITGVCSCWRWWIANIIWASCVCICICTWLRDLYLFVCLVFI